MRIFLSRQFAPWWGVAGISIVLVATLHLLGRIWWCACGSPNPFSLNVWSSHNSQHLIDPYTTSHIEHGLIFYFLLRWVFPRLSFAWVMFVGLVIEAGWEIFENTEFVINRYRAVTASLDYHGDTVLNSLGDLVSCGAGILLAWWVGWRWSVAVFVVLELVMLATIRDNLILNIVMLVWPLEAIKQWQMAH